MTSEIKVATSVKVVFKFFGFNSMHRKCWDHDLWHVLFIPVVCIVFFGGVKWHDVTHVIIYIMEYNRYFYNNMCVCLYLSIMLKA